VLIVDSNEFYGETGATHSLREFHSWMETQANIRSIEDKPDQTETTQSREDHDALKEVLLTAKASGTLRTINTWFRHGNDPFGLKFCIDMAHQVRSTGTLQSAHSLCFPRTWTVSRYLLDA
jgi:hypothetical protein